MPELPEKFTHVAMCPTGKLLDIPTLACQFEVVPPADAVFLPLLDQLFAGQTLPCIPVTPNVRHYECFDTVCLNC
jgi:hypothetical protein